MSIDCQRTQLLIGDKAVNALKNANALVVGLGGVGGYALEMLCRAGINSFTVIDCDVFEPSNLNRQLLSVQSNIGINKTQAANDRLLSINPEISVRQIPKRFNANILDEVFDRHYDVCIDAIDSVKDKAMLAYECANRGIFIISALGAGNRLSYDFKVTDIFSTQNDPLAKALRKELRALNVKSLAVVCSVSPPDVKPAGSPASISYPPAIMGCMLGAQALKHIITQGNTEDV